MGGRTGCSWEGRAEDGPRGGRSHGSSSSGTPGCTPAATPTALTVDSTRRATPLTESDSRKSFPGAPNRELTGVRRREQLSFCKRTGSSSRTKSVSPRQAFAAVPQFRPLWALPFALLPGGAGRCGGLGAFPPGTRLRLRLQASRVRASVLLSHGSITGFYVGVRWTVASCLGDATPAADNKARRPSLGMQTPVRRAEAGEGTLTLPPKAGGGPEAPAPSGHFHSARGRGWRPARGWAAREPPSAPRPASAGRTAGRSAEVPLRPRGPGPLGLHRRGEAWGALPRAAASLRSPRLTFPAQIDPRSSNLTFAFSGSICGKETYCPLLPLHASPPPNHFA